MSKSVSGLLPGVTGSRYYPAVRGFRGESVPALLLERCARTPDKVAYRIKDRGIYKEMTWREYTRHVENLCLGMVEMGLEKGDRVAIMGDAFVELCWAEIAPQCAGAISFGIYPTCSIEQAEYYLNDSGAKFAIVYNQEFVDKILTAADKAPKLEKVIVIDDRAMFMYSDPRIITLEDVEERGAKIREQNPDLFKEMISKVKADDISSLCYTSGTTGDPKAGIYKHTNWTNGWYCFLVELPDVLCEDATTVAFMPPAHIVGRLIAVYLPIVAGYTVYYGESADAMQETLFDIAPTMVLGAPRTFEKFAAQVLVSMESTSWIKKVIYNACMKIGRRYIRNKWDRKKSIPLLILYRLAVWSAFRSILDKFGLTRINRLWVGAAPVPPEIMALFQIWGVNMVELLGSTEGGVICTQKEDFPRPGNTGTPALGVEFRIADNGEALIRNNSCSGYWQNDEATNETIKDGWVYSGDAMQIVEGDNFKIYDRIKDVILTSGGKTISPVEIEKAIKTSPYISECIAYGDARKYPAALIEIDFDTVSDWARTNGILYTSFTSLATHPRITELISAEVAKGNEKLARVEQVKKFRIIPKELDPEEESDPVTPTRKVQRQKMYERWKDLVESMYGKAPESRVAAELGDVADEVK